MGGVLMRFKRVVTYVFAFGAASLGLGVVVAAQCFNDPTCVLYVLDSVTERNGYALNTESVGSSQQTYIDATHISVDNGGGSLSSSEVYTTDGSFSGDVYATSLNADDLNITGSKSFKIDDPIAPADKFLFHSSVESPDMKNIYDGVAGLDDSGTAWITLPNWFSSLNGDFRYQLTAIGRPAGLYVAEEISGNKFKIAGGAAQQRVSWQVTGIRRDPTALRVRQPAERDKKGAERGHYVDPIAYGQPLSAGMPRGPRPKAESKPPLPKAGLSKISGNLPEKTPASSPKSAIPVGLAGVGLVGAALLVGMRRQR
jgi:hypothetical protein